MYVCIHIHIHVANYNAPDNHKIPTLITVINSHIIAGTHTITISETNTTTGNQQQRSNGQQEGGIEQKGHAPKGGDDALTAAAVAAVEEEGAAVLTAALSRSNTPVPNAVPAVTTSNGTKTANSSTSQHVLVSSPDMSAASGSVYAFRAKANEDPSVVGPLFEGLAVNKDRMAHSVPHSVPAAPMTTKHSNNANGKSKGFTFQEEEVAAEGRHGSNGNNSSSNNSNSGGGGSGDGSRGNMSASVSASVPVSVSEKVGTPVTGLEIPRTPPQKWRDEDRQGWIDRMKVLECGITRSKTGRHCPSVVAESDEAAAVKVVNRNCKLYFLYRLVVVCILFLPCSFVPHICL